MRVGDKVRITNAAWEQFCEELKVNHQNPGIRVVEDIHPREGLVLLDFPFHWWSPDDLQTTNLVSLDDVRIREAQEFEDDKVAYFEALWGENTFAFNAAIRDLEAKRRGKEDPSKPLRPPQTHYEAELLIKHVRSVANDLARHFGMEDLVRHEDDIKRGGK
jgi:hypothetical protein